MTKHSTNHIVTRNANGLLQMATNASEPQPGRRISIDSRHTTKYWFLLGFTMVLIALFASSCTPAFQKSLFNTGVDSVTVLLEKNTPKFRLRFERNAHGFYHYAGIDAGKKSSLADTAKTGFQIRPELLVKAQVYPVTDTSLRAELSLNRFYMAYLLKKGIGRFINQTQKRKSPQWRGIQQAALGSLIDSMLQKLQNRMPKLEIDILRDSSKHSMAYYYARDKNGLMRSFALTHPDNPTLVCLEPFINYGFINRWLKQEGAKLIDKMNEREEKPSS